MWLTFGQTITSNQYMTLSFLQHKVSVHWLCVHSVTWCWSAETTRHRWDPDPNPWNLIWDVSDWLVGVAKYLSVVGCTCQVCTFRWCKPTKDNQYAWFLHGIPISACSPFGYAVQVNWPILMVAAILTELVDVSIWLCKIATFYSMYGLPWKLLAPLHNITIK